MDFLMTKWDVRPEDRTEDGNFDGTTVIKRTMFEWFDGLKQETMPHESKKRRRLFHGTTTAHLNDILKRGLLTRQHTDNNIWKEHGSHPNLVYMTNKWHYFYAYRVTELYLKEHGKKEGYWWETWESLPCYIEVDVPEDWLVPDEDFVHSRYARMKVRSAIKKRNPLVFTAEESLNHYGTVAVVGDIPVENIVSFSILGEKELYYDFYLNPNAPYVKDANNWGMKGKGKGDLKLEDLMLREDKSALNGTFIVKDLPKGKDILQIGLNPHTKNSLSILFEH